MVTVVRTYSELIKLKTFDERFEYLRLKGAVGKETFGRDRYLNQMFYNRQTWRNFRRQIIIRDGGCDLGVKGYEFGKYDTVIIHHMNPIRIEDFANNPESLMNPEYVIATSLSTHNAIHFGVSLGSPWDITERSPGDTCLWK